MQRIPSSVEFVVLVDQQDLELGTMEKLEAHRQGRLHRAFSVFLFDEDGRVLLQQRAESKYHSPGLWTNTCCSHPRPGESTTEAALRRLSEEMGTSSELEHGFTFLYKADVGQGLIEHELDHVFFGRAGTTLRPDPSEVKDWRWAEVVELGTEMEAHPDRFTPWLRICWPLVLDHLHQKRA